MRLMCILSEIVKSCRFLLTVGGVTRVPLGDAKRTTATIPNIDDDMR